MKQAVEGNTYLLPLASQFALDDAQYARTMGGWYGDAQHGRKWGFAQVLSGKSLRHRLAVMGSHVNRAANGIYAWDSEGGAIAS